jgi:glutamyl-tRNA reductase
MARLALQYLRAEGIKNIVLTAHHFERAQQLGREFDVQVIPIEKASIFFQRSDVVIGAAQQQVKIDWTALKNGGTGPSGQKKNRFILDFGIPPNFDPRLGVAFDADCFTFDDLRRLHTSPTELFGGFELAWTMVMKESQRFVGALLQLHQSPVLTAYLSRVFRDQEDGKRATAMDAIRHFFVRRADRLYPSQNSHPKNSRTLSNNCRPENPSEIVRHVRKIKTFKLPLAYN